MQSRNLESVVVIKEHIVYDIRYPRLDNWDFFVEDTLKAANSMVNEELKLVGPLRMHMSETLYSNERLTD
ncbi:hypothetical protein C0989_006547 [Termitomyces sp. Mn162]|nr:hypothetical protein C0989_006547 [Termitomyces sp. Mn162]